MKTVNALRAINARELIPEHAKLYQVIEAYLKDRQSSGGLSIEGLAKVAEQSVELAVLTITTLKGLADVIEDAHTPEEKEEALKIIVGGIALMRTGTKAKLTSMIEENVELFDEAKLKAVVAAQKLETVTEERAGHA